MGDMREYWNDYKEHKRQLRERLGVECPKCRIVQPKRIPTILLPQQRCKVCGYVDPRKKENLPTE